MPSNSIFFILHCVISENQPIEYLEEDASYFENQTQSLDLLSDETIHRNEHNHIHGDTINDLSQFEALVDTLEKENTNDTTVNDKGKPNLCKKCLQLEVKLQKSQMVISKLQKRCADKTGEIKRLRLSDKRSKMANKTLEDLFREIKSKKWISDEGQEVLNVIEPNIYFRLNNSD